MSSSSSTSRAQVRLNSITSALSPSHAVSGLDSNTCASHFDHVKRAPTDAIFLTKQLYGADKDPRKINLGIGAYRTNEGKPYPLHVVHEAEALILADKSLNHEYLPMTGLATYIKLAAKLIFGDDFDLSQLASAQTISGTGALRVAADFLAMSQPNATAYFSNPTWGNHFKVFGKARVPTQKYAYWDAKNRTLNLTALLNDMKVAPEGSIFVLHACAHNPTGVDPTQAQWHQIAAVMKQKQHIAFFDSAYQGFATGDLAKDAYAIRYFASQKIDLIVTQSFAKNLGLYNERAGCIHVLCSSASKAKDVTSQLAGIIRPMYSNPPAHGARIVAKVLGDPVLYKKWKQELQVMSGRILEMRTLLKQELINLGTPGNWDHITSQIGMFSFTGLSVAQCKVMKSKHHVYLLNSGRISMSGVNTSNAKYLAQAINDVVRNIK